MNLVMTKTNTPRYWCNVQCYSLYYFAATTLNNFIHENNYPTVFTVATRNV